MKADAVEAIIAAVYLDSDWDQCGQFLLPWYKHRILDAKVIQKHNKTALQELLQKQGLSLPIYTSTSHDNRFVAVCRISGIQHETEGVGVNKQLAEMDAAGKMLLWLGSQ